MTEFKIEGLDIKRINNTITDVVVKLVYHENVEGKEKEEQYDLFYRCYEGFLITKFPINNYNIDYQNEMIYNYIIKPRGSHLYYTMKELELKYSINVCGLLNDIDILIMNEHYETMNEHYRIIRIDRNQNYIQKQR
jgi:hypothetical protein